MVILFKLHLTIQMLAGTVEFFTKGEESFSGTKSWTRLSCP